MTDRRGSEDFALLARELATAHENVFWLDSGPAAESGTSYVGVGGRVLVARAGEVRVDGTLVGDDVLTVLERLVAESPRNGAALDIPFRGGWVGVLGYEYGAGLVGVPADGDDLPQAMAVEAVRLWSLDHASGRIELILGEDERAARQLRSAVTTAPRDPASELRRTPTSWRHDGDAYRAAIERCLAAIGRGDAYQVCLTNEVRVPTVEDPFEVYLRLRRGSPAPHGVFLRIADVAIVGSSPERFLSVSDAGGIETRPIKGTRRRDDDVLRDTALAEELREDPKERAENLMIVDLMRNDLGRVAQVGSVAVPELFSVESHPAVHQLVSSVTALLAPGLSGIDVVRASFPAGSMTGAPKHRAMTILHELEGGPRGLYAGAVGWFGWDGALDLAMMIRTMVIHGGEARIGTGGGITALSDSEREVDETLLKARPLLAVLGADATLPGPSA